MFPHPFKSVSSKLQHEEDTHVSLQAFVLMEKPHLFSLGVF